MASVTTSDIEEYKARRLGENAAAASVNRDLACLRRAYRLALDAGDLVTMPRVRLLHENNVRRGFFERHEFEAVRAELPEWLRPAVTFAYLTGWRFRSEVLPLTTDRVDLGAGVVRLDPGTTKSGQGRTFYVTAELRALLQAQLATIATLRQRGVITPRVFHRPDGSPIRTVAKLWRDATERAGYPGRLLHDFRRTAVRNLERAGVPRSTAMQMVGHQTESIYRRYAIVDEQMHREAAERLDAWAKAGSGAGERRGRVRAFRRR
jgi:integrase